MSWWALVLVAFGLAMDAFAVSLAAGLVVKEVTSRHVFRLAFHFGLFQAMMPILGWLVGSTVAALIADYDHWVAFGLLSFIGGKMLLDARKGEGPSSEADPTRGWTLVTLSIATSIDALAVGLSIAFLRVSIWMPAVVIGLVAAGMSAVGVTFGSRLGRRWRRWAGLVGGLVLIGIGIRILVSHLTGDHVS